MIQMSGCIVNILTVIICASLIYDFILNSIGDVLLYMYGQRSSFALNTVLYILT